MLRRFLKILGLIFAIDVTALILLLLWLPSTDVLKPLPQAKNKDELPEVLKKNIRSYTPIHRIPRYLKIAILVLEDSRFYQHRGFDIEEMNNAIYDTLHRGKRLRGASTITQQTAKTVYLYSDRSYFRKILEAFVTIKLEATLPKNKIFEIYLNSIDWGRGLIGISAAAKYYFKKKPADLSLKECVYLAAIIPNPSRFGSKLGEKRSRFVRKQMMKALNHLYRSDKIALGEFYEALMQPLGED